MKEYYRIQMYDWPLGKVYSDVEEIDKEIEALKKQYGTTDVFKLKCTKEGEILEPLKETKKWEQQ